MDDMKIREKEYFNTEDAYLYDNNLKCVKESKATFDKGFWWFDDFYKATTVKCVKIDSL